MKRLQPLLAVVLAAVLVFGTAVTAIAAPDTPMTRVYFNLGGGVDDGVSSVSTEASKTVLHGYKLLDVTPTKTCEHTDEDDEGHGDDCYAYQYSLRTDEKGGEALNEIMIDALKEVLGVANLTDADLIENLGKVKTAADAEKFANLVGKAIDEQKIDPDKDVTVDNSNASVTNIEQGYWLFIDKSDYTNVPGAAYSPMLLDTLRKSEVTVDLKKEVPTIDKEVSADEEDYGEAANVSVGDEVYFKLTSKVPDMTGYSKYYFVVTDTLSKGLDLNEDSLVVKIGGTELKRCDETHQNTAHESCGYTVDVTGNSTKGTELEIVFVNFIQYAERKGTEITITYSATLTKDAEIGTDGNQNSVKLEYSNKPGQTDDGDPDNPDKPGPNSPTGETPESTTRTYTTGIELVKVDPEGNRLTGAKFQIKGEKTNIVLVKKDVYTVAENGEYWKLKDGTYTKDDPTAPGIDQDKYADITARYSRSTEIEPVTTTESVYAEADVGSDGVLRFDGLGVGTYTIEEIEAPDNYNPIPPFEVTITFVPPANIETNPACTWTADGYTVVDGRIQIRVENHVGPWLPSTGGIGTTIFYLAGVILVAGAGAALVMLGRKSGKRARK